MAGKGWVGCMTYSVGGSSRHLVGTEPRAGAVRLLALLVDVIELAGLLLTLVVTVVAGRRLVKVLQVRLGWLVVQAASFRAPANKRVVL